ncbi:hypothetical protein ABWI14_36580, partial [Streptomyces capoamus]
MAPVRRRARALRRVQVQVQQVRVPPPGERRRGPVRLLEQRALEQRARARVVPPLPGPPPVPVPVGALRPAVQGWGPARPPEPVRRPARAPRRELRQSAPRQPVLVPVLEEAGPEPRLPPVVRGPQQEREDLQQVAVLVAVGEDLQLAQGLDRHPGVADP